MEQRPQKKVLKSIRFNGTYTQGEKLGEGAQASVYKFYHQIDKQQPIQTYACKQTDVKYLIDCSPNTSELRWTCMIRELVILEMIDSPNVIKVYEFIRTRKNFYMIQEYANGGSLQELLDIKGKFKEAIAKSILKQIINGCSSLYALKVVHRDLKLDNILIHFPNRQTVSKEILKELDLEKEEFVVKIADLGFSRAIQAGERAQTGCGTPLLMAPEILFQKGYDYKVDVWALGALYFTLLTSMHVFNADSMQQLEQRVLRGDWAWPKSVDFSLQGLEFLQQTFQFDSAKRLSWKQLVHHPYLSMQQVDSIPLQILYDLDEGTGTYKNNKFLVINTKDPSKFQSLYIEATAKIMQQHEVEFDKCITSLVEKSDSSLKNEILLVDRKLESKECIPNNLLEAPIQKSYLVENLETEQEQEQVQNLASSMKSLSTPLMKSQSMAVIIPEQPSNKNCCLIF